jgi:hypothetical protein
MKIADLIKSVYALNDLIATSMPVGTAWKIYRLGKQVNIELQTFNELRDAISSDDSIMEQDKVAKIEALSQVEVDIKIPDISIAEMGDVNIRPAIFAVLEWLFKEQ